jgi:hypothetical protein
MEPLYLVGITVHMQNSASGRCHMQCCRALPPERMDVYMGIFNFFIVIPQIVVAILVSRAMDYFPRVNRLTAVVFGGVCMLVAGILTLFLRRTEVVPRRLQMVAEEEGVLTTLTPPESLITPE